jgi:hypothetical protein
MPEFGGQNCLQRERVKFHGGNLMLLQFAQ